MNLQNKFIEYNRYMLLRKFYSIDYNRRNHLILKRSDWLVTNKKKDKVFYFTTTRSLTWKFLHNQCNRRGTKTKMKYPNVFYKTSLYMQKTLNWILCRSHNCKNTIRSSIVTCVTSTNSLIKTIVNSYSIYLVSVF